MLITGLIRDFELVVFHELARSSSKSVSVEIPRVFAIRCLVPSRATDADELYSALLAIGSFYGPFIVNWFGFRLIAKQ